MREFDNELGAKQEAWVEHMLRPECDGAFLLALDVGLGKTRTALLFAKARGDKCILIAAPNDEVISGWKRAIAAEYPELPVFRIDSSKEGTTARNNFRFRADGIYLITHALWEGRAWRKERVKKRRKNEPDKYRKVDSGEWAGPGYLFILDESHVSMGEWTNRALMNLDPRVFRLALSGTPFGDSFGGAWKATRWMWPHRIDIIPESEKKWQQQWAITKYNPHAPGSPKVTGEQEPGAFVSALPGYIREESTQTPAKERIIWVDLYPEQRRIYDELDARMVAWIEENPLVAEYSITKRARQRQTALAVPSLTFVKDKKGNDTNELDEVYFEEDAESVKTDTLFDFIEGRVQVEGLVLAENEPLLILTDSQRYARILTHRLNERYGDVAREWSGAVAKTPGKQARTKDRPHRAGIKQDFMAGKIRYIVGVYAAMGTGTDELQYTDARVIVGMSLPDYRTDKHQGIGRLNRQGQEQEVWFVPILARDTVDTGQVSKQMDDAIKMSKIIRAEHRKKEREEILERLRNLAS